MTLPSDYSGANLVFVVGCPRSGTTWVQRLLASHPCVQTGQESDVFDEYVGPLLRTWRRELHHDTSGRGGVGLACYFTDDEFRATLAQFLQQLLQPMVGALEPGELFLEKTPSHVLFAREIHELLPAARFIHVLRDARDTVASLLEASKGWGHGWAPRQARHAANTWVTHIRAATEARTLLPDRQWLEIRYEDLHVDGAVQLRRVADWLGLAWSDDEIARALQGNTAAAARAGQATPIPLGGEFARTAGRVVREPAGFVGQARAGTWRSKLTPLDRLSVWQVARTAMASAGYPWATPWSA